MKTPLVLLSIVLLCAAGSYAQVAGNNNLVNKLTANSIMKIKGISPQKNINIESGAGGKSSLEKNTGISSEMMSTSSSNNSEGVVPKSIIVNSNQSYIVPDNVNFYILDVYSVNSNSMKIDGLPFTFGKYNYWDGTNPVVHLAQPLIAGTGSVITGSDTNDIYVNGYLVGNGTSSGNNNSAWTCGDLLEDDRDGKSYTTVQIGNQCWMAENLNIGTMINGSSSDDNQTDNGIIEKYCYDNDTSNCTTYGGLYQWDEMMQYVTDTVTQGICPSGWHVPTDYEYKVLEMQLGMSSSDANNTGWRGTDEGSKLAGNESLWTNGVLDQNTNFGTSGFDALPSGYRLVLFFGDMFSNITKITYFWSSNEDGSNAMIRHINYNHTEVSRGSIYKISGFSVRCVKD